MKNKHRNLSSPIVPKNKGSPANITNVGNISGGKGFAIGAGAKTLVIEIGNLFNLGGTFKFMSQYWLVIAISIILQGIIVTLWLNYTNRFLVPIGTLIISMCLLEISILTGSRLNANKYHPLYLIVLAISLISLVGVSASEYKRIKYPSKFLPEVFGVAIAQFGEGPDYNNSLKARELSQIVLEQLTKQAQENPDLDFVQFRSIGLVKTQGEAFEDGSRIGADLVIWGQLQVSATETILHFSIIETPDKVSNPMFPRALPLYDVAASSLFRVTGQEADEISQGTNVISAFIFGLANFFKRDFGAAAGAFEEALAISTYGEENDYKYLSHFYYGLTLQRLNKLEEANAQFQQATSIHPDDPAPWIASAFDNNSLGDFEEARQQAQIAFDLSSDRIQIHPDDYVNYFNRAQANEILRNWDSALADFQTARDKAPESFIAHIGIARIQLFMNQPQAAIQSCKDAIHVAESRDANPAWAYLYLGHTYQIIGDSKDARLALGKAVELAPEVDYMHYKLGQFLEGTGSLSDSMAAEEEYKSNIKLSDNKAWAFSEYASYLARQNRLEEAVVQYRSALQYNSQAVMTWIDLAKILVKLNRNVEAQEAYKHSIELNPKEIYARLSFGAFLFTQGEYKSAINEWEFARQLDPNNCDLLLNLGQTFEILNEDGKAKALYLDAVSRIAIEDRECQMEAKERLNSFPP